LLSQKIARAQTAIIKGKKRNIFFGRVQQQKEKCYMVYVHHHCPSDAHENELKKKEK
jgi:hypothetical protein